MNKTQLMRQALRLYQQIEVRLARGESLHFEHEGKKSTIVWCGL